MKKKKFIHNILMKTNVALGKLKGDAAYIVFNIFQRAFEKVLFLKFFHL